MAITIDKAGRVVIPLELRRRLGLEPGSRLEIDDIGDALVLRPVSRVEIETADDGLPILRTVDSGDPLTTDDVRDLVEDGREWPRP